MIRRSLGSGNESVKPGSDLCISDIEISQRLKVRRDNVAKPLIGSEESRPGERSRPHSRLDLCFARFSRVAARRSLVHFAFFPLIDCPLRGFCAARLLMASASIFPAGLVAAGVT
jgi:hypothetical protein